MSIYNLSIPDLVAAGRLAVENTLASPDLLAAVAPYGYDEAALTAARADLDALEAAAIHRLDLYGRQRAATHERREAWRAFQRDTYAPHVVLTRLAFRGEPGTLRRLGLDGARARDFDDWLGQARLLYDNALADAALTARLAARGVPEAALTAAREALDALAAQGSAHADRKGLAQQATRDRDALRRRVADWLSAYRQVARVALRAQPDWLERIGVLARSDP